MALQQQPQAAPAGGLNQARPQQPAQPPKQENLAARAAGMEQEEAAAPEDFFTKTMRDLQEQRSALNQQTTKLLESLDARQNRLFDPMLMKVAAGFAKPTKTGSFGESLGYAAEAAVEESEKEFARQQVAEKLKYELLQKQMEQAQQQAIQAHMMGKMAPRGVETPSAPTTSMTTPTGGAAERTPGIPMAAQEGTQVAAAPSATRTDVPQPMLRTGAPRQQPLVTDRDIQEAMILDPSGKLAQQYRELMKVQQEDIIQVGDRPYSRSRQAFLEQDPNRIVEVDFGPLFGAPKKVPYSTYQQWKQIHDSGDRAKELEFFYSKNWIKRPEGAKPGEVKEPQTAEERATESKIIEARRTEQIKQESARIEKLETNFDSGRDVVNIARGMRELATSNKRAFDLMNDDGVAAAMMRAAKAGIQAGNLGSISVPTDVLYQGVKLSKEDREALQLFARDYANLTVKFRQAERVKGEGATTEREGDLYAALGALPTDTARVIRMKAEFLELKGKYDQEVFRAWNKFSKDPRNSYRDFLASDELQTIKDAYDKRLTEVQKANSDILSRGRRSTEAPKPAPAAPAAAPAAPQSASAPQEPAAPRPPPKKGTAAYNALPSGGLYDDNGTIRRKP